MNKTENDRAQHMHCNTNKDVMLWTEGDQARSTCMTTVCYREVHTVGLYKIFEVSILVGVFVESV